MCGLAGAIRTNLRVRPASSCYRTALNLMVTSQMRGLHSSGVTGLWYQPPSAQAPAKKRARRGVLTCKGAGVGPAEVYHRLQETLVERVPIRKNLSSPWFHVLMGHSRHATIGDINEENAHPFRYHNNRFVGTHNGTIGNAEWVYKTLLRNGKPRNGTIESDKDFTEEGITDSEIILYCLYRYGPHQVYALAHGAWAFVFYDQLTDSVYFLRNLQRNLYCYFDYVNDILFYSSERDMLEFAVKREMRPFLPERCRMFGQDTLYQISLRRNIITTSVTSEFPWTNKTDLSEFKYKPPEYIPPSRTRVIYPQNRWDRRGTDHKGRSSVPACQYDPHDYSYLDHDDDDDDYGKEEKKGCLHCGGKIEGGNYLEVKYHGKVCGTCIADRTAVNNIVDQYTSVQSDPIWVNLWEHLEAKKDNRDD